MKILLTGGLGYIGSHTALCLIEAGYEIVIIDNLSNSRIGVIDRLESITGAKLKLYTMNLTDRNMVSQVFSKESIDAVVHFASSKSVSESVQDPISYFDNNIVTLIGLLQVMSDFDCRKIVFSSSCTVYGGQAVSPISEVSVRNCESPYGLTKIVGEDLLSSVKENLEFDVGILRYFNPVGAHWSGRLGEDSLIPAQNLFPQLSAVAFGIKESLKVFGSDYPTVDGTGVRDFIHIMDLAKAHYKSLKAVSDGRSHCVNVGTGVGYSVSRGNKRLSTDFWL